MSDQKRSQKEIMSAGLRKRLEEFRHKHWRYREKFGEIWPGIFDGAFAKPQMRFLTTCRVVPRWLDILRALPKAGVFAEIGMLHGDFVVEVIDKKSISSD